MKMISQYNSMTKVHQLRDLKYIPCEKCTHARGHTHTHTYTKWTTGGRVHYIGTKNIWTVIVDLPVNYCVF